MLDRSGPGSRRPSPTVVYMYEAFTGRTKRQLQCPHCLSDDHSAARCPHNPSPRVVGWFQGTNSRGPSPTSAANSPGPSTSPPTPVDTPLPHHPITAGQQPIIQLSYPLQPQTVSPITSSPTSVFHFPRSTSPPLH